MPFDLVKTCAEKEGCVKDYTFRVIRYVYRNQGWNKLYVGWQFRFLQYTIQAILTCSALENLDRKRKIGHENGKKLNI